MSEIKLNVNGMMCGGCEKRIVNAVSCINGIKEVVADHATGTVIVKGDNEIDRNIIKEEIENLDFEVLEDQL